MIKEVVPTFCVLVALLKLTCLSFLLFVDAKAMQLFGAGEVGPVFLSEVECIGTEVTLTACPKVGIGNHSCSLENTAAGVACGKISENNYNLVISNASICSVYFTDVSRCKDESGTPLLKFKSDERYVYTVQSIVIYSTNIIHVPGLGFVKHTLAV